MKKETAGRAVSYMPNQIAWTIPDIVNERDDLCGEGRC
jgi:hypothetical protein